jgi:large subunit ribosomal protein L24
MTARAIQRQPTVPEIRKGDTIVVLSGRDAGKRGTVERVLRNPQASELVQAKGAGRGRVRRTGYWKPATGHPASVVVEGINVAKRHTKPRPPSSAQMTTGRVPASQHGGILDIAQPLPIGKVMLICPKCDQPTRIGHATLENGKRIRVCKRCGESLERPAS